MKFTREELLAIMLALDHVSFLNVCSSRTSDDFCDGTECSFCINQELSNRIREELTERN